MRASEDVHTHKHVRTHSLVSITGVMFLDVSVYQARHQDLWRIVRQPVNAGGSAGIDLSVARSRLNF